jgi:alanine-synthesizing transaminase
LICDSATPGNYIRSLAGVLIFDAEAAELAAANARISYNRMAFGEPPRMFSERTNWNLEPNRLSRALAEHRAAGKRLFDLTVSNPTECGFAYEQTEILRAFANPAALKYDSNPKGLRTAREAVAGYYADCGETVSPEDLILTASTSEAYSYVFRTLCNPDDEILIPAPSYPLFEFLSRIQDVKLKRYPLIYDHGWQMDFHGLEQAITPQTRGVVVVNPNNPTGHFCTGNDVPRLNRMCLDRGMAIIADEVFLDYPLEPGLAKTSAANAGALTFTMSGLSKICGLPQMKLAWLLTTGPKEQKKQALDRLEVIADSYLSPGTPVQLAAPALLQSRRKFQEQVTTRVRKNLAEMDHQLGTQKSCCRLEGEGGWNGILRVPATRPDEDLAIELLRTRDVYAHPGDFYDFTDSGYLVVSLITPEKEFAEGMKRLLSMF